MQGLWNLPGAQIGKKREKCLVQLQIGAQLIPPHAPTCNKCIREQSGESLLAPIPIGKEPTAAASFLIPIGIRTSPPSVRKNAANHADTVANFNHRSLHRPNVGSIAVSTSRCRACPSNSFKRIWLRGKDLNLRPLGYERAGLLAM